MKPCKVAIPNKKYNHNAEQLNFVVSCLNVVKWRRASMALEMKASLLSLATINMKASLFFFYFSLHYFSIALSLYSMVVVSFN